MISSKIHLTSLLGLGMALIATNAPAYTGQKLSNKAKISIKQARTIALNAYSGTITDEELERETGGSGLRYTFVIRKDVLQEVGVDAMTSVVLENAPEGPNPD